MKKQQHDRGGADAVRVQPCRTAALTPTAGRAKVTRRTGGGHCMMGNTQEKLMCIHMKIRRLKFRFDISKCNRTDQRWVLQGTWWSSAPQDILQGKQQPISDQRAAPLVAPSPYKSP